MKECRKEPSDIEEATYHTKCFYCLYTEAAAFQNDVGRDKIAKKIAELCFPHQYRLNSHADFVQCKHYGVTRYNSAIKL